MRIKQRFEEIYGFAPTGFSTRLAEIGNDLVAKHKAAQDRRHEETMAYESLAGQGPLIEAMTREIQAAEREELAQSPVPVCTTFDAFAIVKDASKRMPNDHGLRMAAYAFQTRWQSDPNGHLTVGEVVSARNQYADMFPKSAVKEVIDNEIPDVGFALLPNVPLLTRLASEISDQESYERVVEDYNLDGDHMDQIRARAFLRGMAELGQDADELFTPTRMTTAEAIDRALNRYAQEYSELGSGMYGEDAAQPVEGLDEPGQNMPMDGPGGPPIEEPELPLHDEMSEERVSVESPISGDELVVELAVAEDEGVEGLEPEGMDALPNSQMGGNLPEMSENTNPMSQMAQLDEDEGDSEEDMDEGDDEADSDEDFDDIEDDDDGMELEDVEDDILPDVDDEAPTDFEVEDEFSETRTIITDPSSGQDLELILRPIQDAEDVDDVMEDEDIVEDEAPEMDLEDDNAAIGIDMKSAAKNKSKRAEGKKLDSVKPKVDAHPNAGAPQGASLPEKDVRKDWPKSKGKKTSMSKDEILQICAAEGIQPTEVEEEVLASGWIFGGKEVTAGVKEWSIGLDDSDSLFVCRYAANSKGDVAEVVRQASIYEFDEVLNDFMARVAASVKNEKERVNTKHAYRIVTEIPDNDQITARRMMAAIEKVVKSAEGEIDDEGNLHVIAQASEVQVARIKKILADTYQVREIVAQQLKIDPSQQKLMTERDHASPYVGETPIDRQNAGQPAKPLKAKVQTPRTGTGAQQDFIRRHTDPLKGKKARMDGPPGDPGMDPGMGEPMRDPMPPVDMGGGPDMGMAGPPVPGMPGQEMMMPGMQPMQPQDATQMSIDFNGAQGLQPEDQTAVKAAMEHFRNTGMTPLESLDKFVSAYKAMLEKYGDKTAPQRSMAEASIVREMVDAFKKPAVLPMKTAQRKLIASQLAVLEEAFEQELVTLKRVANLLNPPKPGKRPNGKVTVSKDWPEGELKSPGGSPHKGPARGKHPSTDITTGDPSDDNFDGTHTVTPEEAARLTRGKGKLPKTNLNTDGSKSFESKMDGLSKSAPNTYRSKKKGDLIIRLDPELGMFEVRRGEKTYDPFDDFQSAVEFAQTRAFGYEDKVYVDNGDGTFDEV